MRFTFANIYLPQYFRLSPKLEADEYWFYGHYDSIYTSRKQKKHVAGFREAREKKPFKPICFVKFHREDCGVIYYSPMSFCDWEMPADQPVSYLVSRNTVIRRMRKPASFRYSQKEAERYLRRLGIGVKYVDRS